MGQTGTYGVNSSHVWVMTLLGKHFVEREVEGSEQRPLSRQHTSIRLVKLIKTLEYLSQYGDLQDPNLRASPVPIRSLQP